MLESSKQISKLKKSLLIGAHLVRALRKKTAEKKRGERGLVRGARSSAILPRLFRPS